MTSSIPLSLLLSMERALIRLQVLTPLSLLLAIASLLLCSTVASPNIAAIARLHPTSLTPNINVVEAYIGAIWLAQIAYCVGLASVLGLREETKVVFHVFDVHHLIRF
jgi:hypothetical protein